MVYISPDADTKPVKGDKSWVDVSQLLAKACLLYFRDATSGRKLNIEEKAFVPTTFHQELANPADTFLFHSVFQQLENEKLLSLVLNTEVHRGNDVTGLTALRLPQDLAFVWRVFHKLDDEEQDAIVQSLSTRYDIKEDIIVCKEQAGPDGETFNTPLALCALSGNKERFLQLLNVGADPFATNSSGNNIVHSLVKLSDENPEDALKLYHALMDYFPSAEDKNALLNQKNKRGKKPLDLAAEFCLPEMFMAIFSTNGVYRFVSRDCLDHQHVLYDVSDYEGRSSTNKSPLAYLKSMTDQEMTRADRCKFFKYRPLVQWTETLFKHSRGHLYINMLYWLLLVCLAMVQVGMFVARGQSHAGIDYTLIWFAVDGIIHEIAYVIRTIDSAARLVKNLRQNQFPATFTTLYRIVFFAFCCNTFVLCLLHRTHNTCWSSLVSQVLHVINVFLGPMSLLFFLQLNYFTGHLMITLQRMLYDVLVFLSIGFLVYLTYAMAMYILHNSPACVNSGQITLRNSTRVFSTPGRSMYETLLLILSITSPNPLYFDEAHHPGIAIAVYVNAVLACSILLLNLLIGMMGQRVTEIAAHKECLLLLERISITILSGEQSTMSWFWIRRLHKYKLTWPAFRWVLRHFRCNEDYSKVYVEVVESRTVPN